MFPIIKSIVTPYNVTASCAVALLLVSPPEKLGAQTILQGDQGNTVIYSTPEKGGPRQFQVVANDASEVQLYEMPSLDSAQIKVLADSSVLSNLGCIAGENRIWCHVRPLQEELTGYTLGEYLVPARGPDGTILMGTDNSPWIEYSTRSNGDIYFYDNERVEKNGNQISVWIRIRYKTSVMAASSYQSLLKLDCSENSETILQDTFYTDKDWAKPAMATNTNAKPKKQVQENSATSQLMSILCKGL